MCSAIFSFLIIDKTNRFHVAVGLFSNRSQRTSKCGKNISDTLASGSCATSLLLPYFEVICDLLLNRRTATWNLFVNRTQVVKYNNVVCSKESIICCVPQGSLLGPLLFVSYINDISNS